MRIDNSFLHTKSGRQPLILVINPGSTSTKTAVYSGDALIVQKVLAHSTEELAPFWRLYDQLEFRKNVILNFLKDEDIKIEEFDCVVARGGLLMPLESGTYLVDEAVCRYFRELTTEHASNLGAILAKEFADIGRIPAYIVDPVVVDELQPLARVSGLENIERKSVFHALNHKAVARKAASRIGKDYIESHFIVAHLGGGISVGAHSKGRVIDVNNALDGDGPFSPERTGGLPLCGLLEMFYHNHLTEKELRKTLVGRGGLASYLGTNDARVVGKRIMEGDAKARLIFEAMAYQIAKEIGCCATVLKGKIDGIVLTGGLAHSDMLVKWIEERVSFLGPIMVFPGEDEMEALAAGALRVQQKMEKCKHLSICPGQSCEWKIRPLDSTKRA